MIISSDDRVKYLGQNCKSVVKQVSAADRKSQAPYFKHIYSFRDTAKGGAGQGWE